MKQPDDYVSGPHHYWIHFTCGLVFGGALGVWVGWALFGYTFVALLFAASIAFGFAFSSGRWGDRAWHRLGDWLRWP